MDLTSDGGTICIHNIGSWFVMLFGSVSGIGDVTGIALVGYGTGRTVIGVVDDFVTIGMGEVGGKSG